MAVMACGCGSTTLDANGTTDGGAEASTAPGLAGFHWGGIAGDTCPPGSKPDSGDCPVADCGGGCVATDKCTSGCGAGFSCDEASSYCLPTRTCASSADCGDGETCAWREWGFSQGLCAPIPADVGATCSESSECAFPSRCVGGVCALPCSTYEGAPVTCPAGWACVENTCAPPSQ